MNENPAQFFAYRLTSLGLVEQQIVLVNLIRNVHNLDLKQADT